MKAREEGVLSIRPYQICTRCIMDTSDPDILFDENGICNHCHGYDMLVRTEIWDEDTVKKKLPLLIDKIKKSGEGKEYDCIIGVSGGVDSTYVAYKVEQLGLRPLAVHLDNGWDSELAVKNIERVLKKLNIDLYTEVLDWEEFSDLQLAFLKGSTPDVEIPTDHAIEAVMMKVAAKYKIKYVLMGSNVRSEGILPQAWSQGIRDWKYIKGVHKRYGTVPLKTFPHFTLLDFIFERTFSGRHWINFLNYVQYNKTEAMKILDKELGWVYYGGKHHESIYTRFFQAYILPRKFRADKRRAHLSALVCSNEITRNQALDAIKEPICPPDLLRQDKEFVIKKLGLTEAEFDEIMALPPRTFKDYPAYENTWYLKILRACYHLPRMVKGRLSNHKGRNRVR
jgi:N-acetyl sugar amidotransferase